ncbi:hypothetical protein [Streptomyces sp. JJ36]|uniref:hypothetical protein n=1 Tax=Streptomyces sp. JJ36 TaxID=2736645 RepID=UPI001F2A5E27|nr:hypothetical protein [Streptomyces sp. JJ36]MCF6525062.1 hypothetical protein [Streptomyces sp. JJ36]
MSGDGDLKISKESANRITQGLRGAIGELKEIGGFGASTDSLQGSGVGDLTLTKMEAGGSGLATAFEGFCEQWEWGVRALVQDANQIAARLGLAAGLLHAEDQYWNGTFKIVANAAAGNPHLSEEEVTSQGWGELFDGGTYTPDYSTESWEKAGAENMQTWKDTGRALLTEGSGGRRTDLVNDLLGVDDKAFDAAVDDAFGPSPEERAQAPHDGGAN